MRTVGLLLIILAFGASAIPAAAGPADAAHKTLACLDKAEADQTSTFVCIGIIQSSCLANNPDPSASACAAKELQFWQVQLDKSWTAAQASLRGYPEMLPDQTAAQKLFLQYRDKSCAIADKVDPGTMPGGSAACQAKETALRVIGLRAIVASLSEH
jgi:uncharacterized protein YecT (DUF1311 family)